MAGIKGSGGLAGYLTDMENQQKPDLWEETLPSQLQKLVSNDKGKTLNAWMMVHMVSDDKTLFNSTVSIHPLEDEISKHHIYPQERLKRQNVPAEKINAIANIAFTTSEINSAIGAKNLDEFIRHEQEWGRLPSVEKHLTAHCIPKDAGKLPYDGFLSQRAVLMAKRFKDAYLKLKE